jgi:hypothetical protein
MRLAGRILAPALLFLGSSLASHVLGASLMAGVARVDLTPPLELKATLGGYGERMSQPATGVHDRVWAKALVLHAADRRFAIVTADVLAFPPGCWHRERVVLPPCVPHPDFLKTGGKEYGLTEDNVGQLLAQLCPTETQCVAIRLGDLAILGVPAEMSAELGLQVKAAVRSKSGVRHVAMAGLADEWISYALSPEEYRRGGYEASVSFYGETLGPTLVEAILRAAGQIK